MDINVNNIKNLSVRDLRTNVDDKDLVDNMNCSNNEKSCVIPFMYKREQEAFGNINSCKYLAYIVIAESTTDASRVNRS